MNISLSPKLEELVQQKVQSGMYTSASEVVREGLRLLDERDAAHEAKLEMLRAEIRKGLESGDPIPADEAFARLRKRINKKDNK